MPVVLEFRFQSRDGWRSMSIDIAPSINTCIAHDGTKSIRLYRPIAQLSDLYDIGALSPDTQVTVVGPSGSAALPAVALIRLDGRREANAALNTAYALKPLRRAGEYPRATPVGHRHNLRLINSPESDGEGTSE